MKSSPDISLNEKVELKYKGETVQGSNVVDLVNDVLHKRKYFNPQGWETFGEALREANVPQDLIGHEDRWRFIPQTVSCGRPCCLGYLLPSPTIKSKHVLPDSA